ncbi:MAG: TRAP transporter large permease subunit [Chromatiales bacterium]|nr:TRAP transporter large permease subunit [Chromatiales bacterium]
MRRPARRAAAAAVLAGARWRASTWAGEVGAGAAGRSSSALFATGLAVDGRDGGGRAAPTPIVVECFITRDLHLFRDAARRARSRPAALMGAVLILLACAMGLTSYLVDAQIPTRCSTWVQTHIHSPRRVPAGAQRRCCSCSGSVLEIYSAIVILAPLIAPIGAAFGIDPIHLGVIFLANLELGFLFPPGRAEPVPLVLAVQHVAADAVPLR